MCVCVCVSQVPEGLDQAVMKMKSHEKALVTVPAQYAYGPQGRPLDTQVMQTDDNNNKVGQVRDTRLVTLHCMTRHKPACASSMDSQVLAQLAHAQNAPGVLQCMHPFHADCSCAPQRDSHV